MRIKKQKPLKRGAGTLLAVSSLPSPYGIGNFGQSAYDFVDFLHRSGQTYWQVLPLGPTSYGDSPYQSFSAFAGNPYFIDPDTLIKEGLLKQEEVQAVQWGNHSNEVDYSTLYKNRYSVLEKAFLRSDYLETEDFKNFCLENSDWLDDYALFMSIKNKLGGKSWLEWPDELRLRATSAIVTARKSLSKEFDLWRGSQYFFFKQWEKLKAYANSLNVNIIGDMPIYVALDSADVWVNYKLFQMDGNRMPSGVAGVSPDLFSKTGQLWGNPLYNWDEMEKDGFAWWRKRMNMYSKLYDIIRIDHFIGIVHYYAIPPDAETAMNGLWLPGPGEKLIAAISQELGGKQIIAEDLGLVSPGVIKLREKAGYPGMRLYQMAFDSDGTNGNLPGYYSKDTVVYGGTHDNETTVGFLQGQKRSVLRFAREYLGVNKNREIPWAMIRSAYGSSAGVVIFQMQDYLELDNSARLNTPSTVGGNNWKWRLINGQIPSELESKLKRFTELYGR